MNKVYKSLEINVIGPLPKVSHIVEMILSVNGRDIPFYMLQINYETLLKDGFFIADGKTKDSGNFINTTNLYKEHAT